MKKNIKKYRHPELVEGRHRLLRHALQASQRQNILISGLNILLILATITFVGIEVRLLTHAQESSTPGTTQAAEPTSSAETEPEFLRDAALQCVTHMKTFMEAKRTEFGEFINTHFRSKKPTTELVGKAIDLLRKYRKDIRDEMNRFVPKSTISTLSGANELPTCRRTVEEEFTIIKQLLKEHIVQNAYAKKSTRLLDAYKEINGKLDKLNFTVGQMAGYFGALSQRIPCYATQCVKQ